MAPPSFDPLRDLTAAIHEVFWITTPDRSRMLYVSPGYERLWQRPLAKLYEDARIWAESIHPDDREHVRATASQILSSEQTQVRYRIVRPSGEIRWIHDKAFPVRDEAGNVLRLAGVAEDITDQRMLEEQLRQTQKLESIGLLAGGIAHDFNNLLSVISANTELLASRLRAEHADRELLEEIDAAVARASAMTRQLLAFSRKQVSSPAVLDVNETIESARKLLRRMLGTDIVMRVSLDPEVGRVRCDPNQLIQVMMNLAVNARDAMPRGGELRIETRHDPGTVTIVVSDTGRGMSEDVRLRMFEPFFTTKPVGEGTGLGMSVVHGIIEQAGGRIEIESELGHGSTIRLHLPTLPSTASASIGVAAPSTRGTERILVVDDDWHVRTATARALRSRGYTVIEASDGPAALEILEGHGELIDLLVTDVVMPGMDGRQLAELACVRQPALPVLFVSGYTEDEVVRRGVQQARLAFLEKPFQIQALASKIRQLLDEGVRVELQGRGPSG